MSEELLCSYRLSSLEDPTDDMLQALMEKVARAARASSANAMRQKVRMLAETQARIKAKTQAPAR